MYRFIFFFLFFIIRFAAFSQDARLVTISFESIVNNENVKINKDIDTIENNKIVISKLKFYISNISFYKDEKLLWQDNANAYLMDAENESSIKLTIKTNIDFNKIKFGLGIDSATNVSGALDGDLDPLKGMYWTWQSGYVNFKLEGLMPDKNKIAQKFEYHLGGYSGDNNAYNTIVLNVENISKINISLDIDKFISNRYVVAHPNIMSPGKIAVDFSKILASCFFIK